MDDLKLGVVEGKFADILWSREPISTKELVQICQSEMNWKRTTTYTVLKKLCDRGIFKTENSVVTALIKRDDFYAMQSEIFVETVFAGSLPAFITAFTKRKELSKKEIEEIIRLIDNYKEV